ncbi:hypothetical protein JCM33374_g1625 [Metschnikowia sp. JCM 33374]|nr:hypothetical protein JCM33374_g1625 [Metschnikowia sp. JCM 33374]
MLRFSGHVHCTKSLTWGLSRTFSRQNQTATATARDANVEDAPSNDLLQQKLREKVLAEALAKEEEAMLKAKALRELKEQTRASVHALNTSASDDISDRLSSLQAQLDSLPDQDKVRQLDEEIEDFLFQSMRLSPGEIGHAPWSRTAFSNASGQGRGSGNSDADADVAAEQSIRTTTNTGFSSQFPNLKPTPDYKGYSDQELFLRHMSHMRQSGELGSVQKNIYEPSADTHKPRAVSELSLASLMAAECHLGHAKALWRPSTQPFIYGEYQGVHLIDLNHTLVALRKAAKVARAVAAKGGIILYVGTSRHPEQQAALEEAARRSNAYCVTHRWIPGTITNFTEVSRQIQGPQTAAVDLGDKPTGKVYTTSEGTVLKPDLIVLMNPVENRNCIGESIKSRIPTIGLCDTNMEPSLLTYPVPCNDDSTRASSLILGVLSRAAKEGVEERHQAFAQYKTAQKAALKSAEAKDARSKDFEKVEKAN